MSTATVETFNPEATRLALGLIRTEMRREFFERSEAIDAILLAVLARQNAFILGPPGTGKSLLIRTLAARMHGAEYFEALLSKTRPDAALLGPYDLPLMQRTGEFHRRKKGTLLTADLAFLDEIGKMSPTLGHELLAALNERTHHEVRDDGSVHPIPLAAAITASNELPASETEDAAALWDRLLIRTQVDYLQSGTSFLGLMRGSGRNPVPTTVAWADVQRVSAESIPAVRIPEDLHAAMWEVRVKLGASKIVASDRRWEQSNTVIQAHAWLEGRDEAVEEDLAVLDYILWSTPDQMDVVRRTRADITDPLARTAMQLMDDIRAIDLEVESRRGQSLDKRAGYGVSAGAKVNQISRDIKKLEAAYSKSRKKAAGATAELSTRLEALRTKIGVVCLELGDVEEF